MAYGQNEGYKATLSALNYGMHFFLGGSKKESMEVPCILSGIILQNAMRHKNTSRYITEKRNGYL